MSDRSGYQCRFRGHEAPTVSSCAGQAWLNNQAAETLYLSSVTIAELLHCIAALPASKRKDLLAQTLDELMGLFKNRVLPFDTDAASHYAELAVTAKEGGRGFPTPDVTLQRLRLHGNSS